ncbi:hypothetical protein [Nocardia sp. NPDC003963]
MTQHDPARVWADRTARVRADRRPAAAAADSAAEDPLVGTVRRIRGFLGEGWRFQTGLAARMPHLFLSGWSW